MFKFDEICELIRLVGSTRIGGVEIEHAGTRLKIEGIAQAPVAESSGAPRSLAASEAEQVVAQASSGGLVDPSSADAVAAADDHLHWVTSPIVGTFYRAPSPDAEPYVKVGDFVEQGHTLCIVEAMKLMNEIEADISGTVVKVLPENAQPVEYGERLFAVRPN
jgi:acetyl-CoA carboxylase biotin carboxyl carrier protein